MPDTEYPKLEQRRLQNVVEVASDLIVILNRYKDRGRGCHYYEELCELCDELSHILQNKKKEAQTNDIYC